MKGVEAVNIFIIRHLMGEMNFNDKNSFKRKNKHISSKLILSSIIILSIIGVLVFTSNTEWLTGGNKNSSKINSQGKNQITSPIAFAQEGNGMSVPDIVKKVGPAVVGVSTKSIVQSGGRNGFGIQEGIGSGFIINNEGYILTNNHVIEGAQEVRVIFNDSREVKAKVINFDPSQDLAVIKIDEDVKVPAVVELGDSDALLVGENVVAIGNPLGKEFIGTVTTGIISAVNRSVPIDGKSLSFLQTDAAINPGNSGGPLLNSHGQVIGINTAKINEAGIEGIGFTIPINTVKARLEALSKPILRIGIAGINITDQIANKQNLPVGIYINEVSSGSPAEKSGLQPGDIITKYNESTVKTIDDLNKIKETQSAGDVVKVQIIRKNKTITTNLTLTE